MSEAYTLPFTEALSESLLLLQHSHWALAQNKPELAKDKASSACIKINKLLVVPKKATDKPVAQLAHYAIKYYKRLLDKGVAALLAQERFCWLTSTDAASGGYLFPVLYFGQGSSMDIAPQPLSDESIRLPDFGPGHPVTFKTFEPPLLSLMNNMCLGGKLPEGQSQPNELQDVYQDVLTDCSFVLSLLSISEVGLTKTLMESVTIFENETAKVRLLTNGCWREVGITTQLPHFPSDTKRYLHVRSAGNELLRWPALIEKAYLTLFDAHYRFDGSNMANDTFALTGWLPEIRMNDHHSQTELSELWKMKRSRCLMIGLGTGRINPALEETLGIISNHDYVLSDYDADADLFTLTNPWAFRQEENKKFRRLFQIDRAFLRHFKFLYLNWKQKHQKETKLFFITSPSMWPAGFLGDKQQFHLQNASAKKAEVWIFVEKLLESPCDFCVSIWKDAKHVIYTSDQYQCFHRGNYVNSKHYLLKLEIEPHQSHIVTVVSRDNSSSRFSITLYHSTENVSIARAKSYFSNTLPDLGGYWNQETSGGNWSHETFINNPQFDLEIETKTRFAMVLGCGKEAVDVNLHLIHCISKERGKKIRKLDRSKLIFDEKYTHGVFFHEIQDLEPGFYKLIASTYNRGQLGEFKIMLAHNGSQPLKIMPVPQALGTFVENIIFEWSMSNRKILEIVTLYNNTDVTFHLRLGRNDAQQTKNYRPAIRASLFDSFTRKPIVITKEWNDNVYGAFLDCRLSELNRSYTLLVERFETGDGACRVSVGSSSRIKIREFPEQ